MRSWRFLLSRRWALFALAVVASAYLAWWLGEWQFGRLEDRKADNAIIRTNESLAPAPVEDVLDVGGDAAERDEWRLVTATGTYDVDQTVVVRYRSGPDGATGVDAVVPLVTGSGTAVVVDRGFLATDPELFDRADLPAPPSGEVTITGWVRQNGSGSSTAVSDLSTRAIDSTRIGQAIDRPVFGGFVDLRDEDPAAADPLVRTELPELDNGPHFFYGLQWWFFGVLAVFGFFYLAWDERRRGPRAARAAATAGDGAPPPPRAAPREPKERKPRRTNVDAAYQRPRKGAAQSERSMPPSTGSNAPETNEAAGERTKAATRPNSAGSP